MKARVLPAIGVLSGTKGQEIGGYEIHMGQTDSQEKLHAFQVFETPQGATDYSDGALNAQGTVLGTYLHGLFHNPDFTRAFLNALRQRWDLPGSEESVAVTKEAQYDKLADVVRRSLDIAAIYKIMEGVV
ncbi:MAG: hypothetical protein A2144_13560 [Chloroflexi bacterium RBG_16_50_9]|nr:MAG: hypothetical protein A2144_13560 [Chloroflexi bacterium RBG_16_50_9]